MGVGLINLPRSEINNRHQKMPAMLGSSVPGAGNGHGALPLPGATPGAGDERMPPPEKKPKPPPSLGKKAASKVSSLSSKLTDLKCLRTQLAGSDL